MKKRIRKISATLLSLCLLFSALGLSPVAYGITIPSEELSSLSVGDVQSFEA